MSSTDRYTVLRWLDRLGSLGLWWRSGLCRSAAMGATVVGVLMLGVGSAAAMPRTVRVNVSSGGVQANGDGSFGGGPGISAPGGLVVFVSSASNLVPGDTNSQRDVFVRNVAAGTTQLVSVSTSGAHGNGDSTLPAISPDGRYVAFSSDSSNLAPNSGCSPGQLPQCLFIRDLVKHTTRIVKNAPNPDPLAFSLHGRYLTFAPYAGPLYRLDLTTGKRVRVSCCTRAPDYKEALTFGGMSSNGNLVAFGINTPSGSDQVYIRNVRRKTTSLVSRTAAGIPGNGMSTAAAISPDGQYVMFTSAATNLVPLDTNHQPDVFVRNRETNTIRRVSIGTHGQADNQSIGIGISMGGRYSVFESTASNLVDGDTNHHLDIFVRDRATHRTTRVDLSTAGKQANSGVTGPAATNYGARWITFLSNSTNLVPADTNHLEDVYLQGPRY